MVELAVIANRDAICRAIQRFHLKKEVDEAELFGYEASVDVYTTETHRMSCGACHRHFW